MIKLIKPNIRFDDVKAQFEDIFASGNFTKGKYVDEFVARLKDYCEVKHCFLTTSATTALTMSLKLLDIGPGDEVLVSDFSFPATANVVEDLGAKPIFVDVDKATFNMLPDQLESKITKKSKAIIFVDALGNPSGLLAIQEMATKHKIPLIEDAACAIGSGLKTPGGLRRCGGIADLTCFSFHPRKVITTGEGGAITTNNEQWAKTLSVKLAHGAVAGDMKLDFIDYGYNYRLPDLQCAMGTVQVDRLDSMIAKRTEIRNQYLSSLGKLGFVPQALDANVHYNVQSVVFTVPNYIQRNQLIGYLKEQGVEATIGTYALSSTTYFKKKYNAPLPNAAYLEANTITFPCFEGLDVQRVTEHVAHFASKHG